MLAQDTSVLAFDQRSQFSASRLDIWSNIFQEEEELSPNASMSSVDFKPDYTITLKATSAISPSMSQDILQLFRRLSQDDGSFQRQNSNYTDQTVFVGTECPSPTTADKTSNANNNSIVDLKPSSNNTNCVPEERQEQIFSSGVGGSYSASQAINSATDYSFCSTQFNEVIPEQNSYEEEQKEISKLEDYLKSPGPTPSVSPRLCMDQSEDKNQDDYIDELISTVNASATTVASINSNNNNSSLESYSNLSSCTPSHTSTKIFQLHGQTVPEGRFQNILK